MTDRAPQVAPYLVERRDDGAGPNVLWDELRQRWPGLTPEEGARGAHIAEEFVTAALVEKEAAHVVVMRALAERRSTAGAMAQFGEAEFSRIADGAGLPLDAVRDAIEAIQRGEPLPLADSQPEEDDHADRDR